MINAITNTIKTRLMELAWAERVGGLTMPVTKYDADGRQEFVFPITNDIEGKACVEMGRYFDMVPNSRYKSALYIEQTGPVRFVQYEKKYTLLQFATDLRVVGWLNLSKMGYTDAAQSDIFSVQVAGKLLETRGIMQVGDDRYSGALVYVDLIGEAEKNQSIFSRYTYQRFANFLIYPFDFFAFDIRATFVVNTNCVVPVQEDEDICEDVNAHPIPAP